MKKSDTDHDGKISYDEFKVSILECEKNKEAGNCGDIIGDMLASKAKAKAEANANKIEEEDFAPTAMLV